MLSKEEAKTLRVQFWGSLEKQMDKIKNPHGSKVSWLNYNTGVKNLYFRMEADENGARLCIDLQFPDKSIRELYYQQFEEFKEKLDGTFPSLNWVPVHEHWNGKTISRIVTENSTGSFYVESDWDEMQDFLKSNFTKLDEFWSEFGEVFHNLK